MIPQKTAFVFPGQGSQLVSMGHELALAYPTARLIFEEANDILGFNLSGLAWDGPEDELNDTLNTQPALLVHSAAVIRVFQELYPGFLPAYVAGHSMGQISALLVAGSLTFQQALLLARTRGRLMKHAGEVNPGGMAAILGLDIPKLEIICHEASLESEIVQVANDNCPGQVVISGASAALDRAVAAAQAAGARRAKRLAVSIAAHSPLMESIQDDFNQAVESSGLLDARIPVVGNVNASPLMLAWELCQDTQAQMTNRVRWTESIQYMERNGIETFVEMGSGSVLVGLIKRIASEATGIAVGTPPDFEKLAVI
jgi:[acyl-carrier-protein] S-malonyltransferase